jgi:GDPmannose 4,6-dehydratase
MSKRALITGVTGQDGSYLAELLLSKGYEVFGLVRRLSWTNYERIQHILDRITLVPADLTDQSSLDFIIDSTSPDEVYNLAAQSFVPTSWSQPVLTTEVDAVGVVRLLEAIRRYRPQARFYQASSSEMFGKVPWSPQNEETPFHPRSPYAVSKVYGHYITVNYRESYGLHASSGICFNHESERRGLEFVTRKITHGVAQCKFQFQKKLLLGNLDSARDWGFAGDYVEAMWAMLQQDEPGDYVIATGEVNTVRHFVKTAFEHVGLDYERYVEIDPKLYRPAEVDFLVGDAGKARSVLGWQPNTNFQALVHRMVDEDMRRAIPIG